MNALNKKIEAINLKSRLICIYPFLTKNMLPDEYSSPKCCHLVRGKLHRTDYHALYPLPEGVGDYFSQNVVAAIDIGLLFCLLVDDFYHIVASSGHNAYLVNGLLPGFNQDGQARWNNHPM